MQYLVFVFLVSLFFSTCSRSGTTEQDAPSVPSSPNVVFILVDDLGYHDLGATGSTYYETPNIDRLAGSSVRFTRAYAGSRVCSPSRATLMLGQYTATHGITDWIGARAGADWRGNNRFTTHLPPDYVGVLPDSALTLAEAFRQGGYHTFFAGKWHLGGEGSLPTDHGFDVNMGGYDKGSPPGDFFDPYGNPYLPDRQVGENLSLRLARETRDFVTATEAPFFALLSFYAVHAPIQTTRERWQHYHDKAVAEGTADYAFVMERRLPIRTVQDNPVYAGLVEQMDAAVGIVLDALDSLGIADNTIVVFTSDNGGVASGDNYATSNLPLRGGKGYQWEGGTRGPLFVRLPGVEGQDISTPVTGADLYPTLLARAGLTVEPTQPIDGQDLSPLLNGNSLPERSLYWHYPHYGNQGGDPSSVVQRGDYKLIHYWEDGHDELYNLAADPAEQHDVAAEQPRRTAELRDSLLAFLTDRGARYPTPDPTYDPVLAEQKDRYFRDTLMSQLEQQRLDMFREDWQPNPDWWGSTVD